MTGLADRLVWGAKMEALVDQIAAVIKRQPDGCPMPVDQIKQIFDAVLMGHYVR